jgi:hypothetical protein
VHAVRPTYPKRLCLKWWLISYARSPPEVLTMWPCKKLYSFTFKFSYLLFCNPTHKTETGTANRWGDYLLGNDKPLGPIIMMGPDQKYWAPVRPCLLHSFLQVDNIAGPFTGRSA